MKISEDFKANIKDLIINHCFSLKILLSMKMKVDINHYLKNLSEHFKVNFYKDLLLSVCYSLK